MAQKTARRMLLTGAATVVSAAFAALAFSGTAAAATQCPTGLDTLTPDALHRATDVAQQSLGNSFPDRNVAGAYVAGATRSDAGPVGQEIISACGPDVQSKSVIVDFVFPAMLPDASRSYGAAVVALDNGRYSVWRTA
ncbi:hypothetical protein [Tomitella gaofuii]|nr:hypothetical protein [Tomitella gaofuii]